MVSRAVMKSRVGRFLRGRIKEYLGRIGAERLRLWCIILMAAMLVGDIVLVLRTGERQRAEPHYSAIRLVATPREQPRRASVKAFGPVWDSLMADPVVKNSWDSLLRLRPGLRDTVRELQRMDSAASGR